MQRKENEEARRKPVLLLTYEGGYSMRVFESTTSCLSCMSSTQVPHVHNLRLDYVYIDSGFGLIVSFRSKVFM